ncbi:tetratricopeptide repeat protein [Polycyclovorans algicola]|uniref:tetratricopeptide repeat protein n=1 Tax=Polycyclovorans algicola TaxID=616992 RepID=UPI0006936CEF|nr:tetratricopeptide repeat protein [Polycyclovorans algicola]
MLRADRPLWLPAVLLAVLVSGCVGPTGRVEQRIDDAPIGRAGPIRMTDDPASDLQRRTQVPQADNNASATDSELHLELIGNMIDQQQYYAAIAHIEAQRMSIGDSAMLRWLEGDARRRLGELEAAEQLFVSLARTGYAAEAQHGLGLIAAKRGQAAKALGHLQAAVVSKPTASEFRNDLGYAYLSSGNFDAALTQLATAAELAPNEPRIRNNLILLLLASGDARRALEMAENSGVDDAGFARLQQRARQFQSASTRTPRTLQ